jgi:minor extracellular serine protease Vpr
MRLFLHPRPGRPYLSVEGRLEGRWVGELERTWLALCDASGSPLTVDATEVVAADRDGLDLLQRMTRRHTTVKGFDRFRGKLIRDVPRKTRDYLVTFRLRTVMRFVLVLFAVAAQGAVVPGRYIVELTTDSVVENAAKQSRRAHVQDAAALTHRAKVRAEHQTMRARIASRGTVLDSTDTVANTLLVEIPASSVAEIAAMPGVRRVIPVRTVHMILDHAVVVNKVVEAWNQVGIDGAGLGVKIAIIDSGIDSTHAGFQDATVPVPAGFPKVGAASDSAYVNHKIIVARSYVSLLPSRDPDSSVRDRVGHGTALAMVAAGARNSGPLASIAGIAPKASLGNYKVFGTPGYNDNSTNDAILKAIDDAVADGMDIINLSLGDDFAPRLRDDPMVQAVERATSAGVIVVAAAGNNGPGWYRISSPATAPSAIAVGASRNERAFGAGVEAAGIASLVAVPGSASGGASAVSGPLADVAGIDNTGLACSSLPSGSLSGKVAIILRGQCTFETKLNLAQRAGAVAAIVYAAPDSPDAIGMSVGAASLPAEMVSYPDGMTLRQALLTKGSLSCTLRFTLSALAVDSNRLAEFSAYGPNVDAGIKPDLAAVGSDVYVATQKLDPNGDMYDASGYIVVDGTSFSSPLVAGAAALLKAARPGLTVAQYRSLLINSAATLGNATVQQTGAGVLDAGAALRSTVAAYPTALGFGAGGATAQLSRALTLTNTGTAAETYTIQATPRSESSAPAPALNSVQLAPGASLELPVEWRADNLTAGGHEGYLRIVAATTGAEARVPYWYGVTSGVPSEVSIIDVTGSGRRNSALRDAVLFRVLDAAGLPVANADVHVTAVSGGGAAQPAVSYDSEVPGLYSLTVRLGPLAGANVFRIRAGDAVQDVSITAQ